MDDLSFVNTALNKVGESALPSLDNTANNAKIETANRHLVPTKKAVLRARDWNCARSRAQLAAVDNGSLGEWEQAYRMPPTSLAMRHFISPYADVRFAKYSLEIDDDGKQILYTNSGNDMIVFTRDFMDVSRWDSLLVDAAMDRLACEYAKAFARNEKMANMFWQSYMVKIEEATGVDEAEGGMDERYADTLVTVRY